MLGYAGKLVNQAATADNSKIVNLHFSGYLGSIPDDDMIFQYAVVSDMRVCHDQAVVSDYGFTLRRCSTVDRNALADSGIVTYFCGCLLSVELQVLWNTGNYSSREDGTTVSYSGPVENDCV